jgi:hypothetical protein
MRTQMTDMAPTAGAIFAPRYPSYVSLDRFIDVERLRSLDSYLTQRIERRMIADRDDFFMNQHPLDEAAPHQPGVREVWLSRTVPGTPYNYLDINRCELWERTPEAAEFALLMDFVDTLPFERTARILLIYDRDGHSVPAHRDHEAADICHEFMWFRTNLRKPFYVLNEVTGEKQYVEGYSAWFDTVNQYHGSDAVPGLSFSFRVDGRFTDEFRSRIPNFSPSNAATPSVWAAYEGTLQ